MTAVTVRYLSATDGKITVFRVSTAPYRAAIFASRMLPDGRCVCDGRIAFSRLPPSRAQSHAAGVAGAYPVRAVTRSQYLALHAQALARLVVAGGAVDVAAPRESRFANAAA